MGEWEVDRDTVSTLSLAHFEVVFLWMTPGRSKIGLLLLGMTMLLLNENFLPNTLTTQG